MPALLSHVRSKADHVAMETITLMENLRDSGWSDANIARAVGAHRKSVYNWRTGVRTPLPVMAKNLERVYNLNTLAVKAPFDRENEQ